MKQPSIITAMMLLGICLILFPLTSCGKPTPELYWHENPQGQVIASKDGQSYATTIDTNDLARLQKEVSFTILLPKFFPDGQDSYRFQMIYFPTDRKISIEYYNLKNKKEIYMIEHPFNDMYYYLYEAEPGLMETQAKLNGDTVITIDGIKMIEQDLKNYAMPRYNYVWHQNDIIISCDIYGYDQTVATKIITTLIK
jgi:hypothetical protein